MRNLCLLVSWPCKLVAAIVGVTAIEEVVADADEATQSPRVIEPREVSVGPTTIVFIRAGAIGRLSGCKDFCDSLHMVSQQIRGNLSSRWIEVKSSRGLAMGFPVAVRLIGPRRSVK
jgi:hypothetical protein